MNIAVSNSLDVFWDRQTRLSHTRQTPLLASVAWMCTTCPRSSNSNCHFPSDRCVHHVKGARPSHRQTRHRELQKMFSADRRVCCDPNRLYLASVVSVPTKLLRRRPTYANFARLSLTHPTDSGVQRLSHPKAASVDRPLGAKTVISLRSELQFR
jgi:hypothetical protein